MAKINLCCLPYFEKIKILEEEIKKYKEKCEQLENSLQLALKKQEIYQFEEDNIMGLNLSSILQLEEENKQEESLTPSIHDLAENQQPSTSDNVDDCQEGGASTRNEKRQLSTSAEINGPEKLPKRSKTMETDEVVQIYRNSVFDVTSTTNSIFGSSSNNPGIVSLEQFLSDSQNGQNSTPEVCTPEVVGELSYSSCEVIVESESQSSLIQLGQEGQNIASNEALPESTTGQPSKAAPEITERNPELPENSPIISEVPVTLQEHPESLEIFTEPDVNPPSAESREISRDVEKILKELDESLESSTKNQTERVDGSKEGAGNHNIKSLPPKNSMKLNRSLSDSCLLSCKLNSDARQDLQMNLVIKNLLEGNGNSTNQRDAPGKTQKAAEKPKKVPKNLQNAEISEKFPENPKKDSKKSQIPGSSRISETPKSHKRPLGAKITKRREEICETPKSGTPVTVKKIQFDRKNEMKSRRTTVDVDLPSASETSKKKTGLSGAKDSLDLENLPLKKRRYTVDEKPLVHLEFFTIEHSGRQLRPRKPPAPAPEPPKNVKKDPPKSRGRPKTVNEREPKSRQVPVQHEKESTGKGSKDHKTEKSAAKQIRARRQTVHETVKHKTADPPKIPKKTKENQKPVMKTSAKKNGGKTVEELIKSKSLRVTIMKEKVDNQLKKEFTMKFK